MDIISDRVLVMENKEMSIIRQGTRAVKHDGSAVLLRKILRELTEIKEKLNTSFNDKGDLLWCKVPKVEQMETERMENLIEIGKNKRKGNEK